MYGRGTMVVQVEISRDRTPQVLTVGLDGALPEAEAEEFLWLDWAVVPRLPHSALAPPVAFAKATPLGILVACYREPTLTPWGVQQIFPHPAVSPMAWKTGLALLEGQQLPFAVAAFVPFQAWLSCQRLDAVADLEARWLATLGRHRDLLEYCRFKGVPVGITHEMDASTLEMPLNAHQREELPLLIERFPVSMPRTSGADSASTWSRRGTRRGRGAGRRTSTVSPERSTSPTAGTSRPSSPGIPASERSATC